MPKENSGSGDNTEESEVYDEGICFLCKKALEDAPDDTMCVVCHRYCHLKCTDLKGHPRLASLASTKALEFRISKDPETRQLMENVTVSSIGKLALFKYHCPACRQKLSRARQYEESQCRTLFNTLIELMNNSKALQPPAPVKKKQEATYRKVKLEPCDASLHKYPSSVKNNHLGKASSKGTGEQVKVRPAMAPSREPSNKKHAPQKNNHGIASDTSSTISEPSTTSSDEFRPSRTSPDTDTGSDCLQSVSTDDAPQGLQNDNQENHPIDVQASPPRRKPRKTAQQPTKKAAANKASTKRTASRSTKRSKTSVTTRGKVRAPVDEETLKLITLKRACFDDPDYIFKNYFKRSVRGFSMSRVYKVAGNIYKKIYFKSDKDIYNLQAEFLTRRIETLESESADLLLKMPPHARREFESLYPRLKKKKLRSIDRIVQPELHPNLFEDSDEKRDCNNLMTIYINHANVLGKYLLIKKFYITGNNYSPDELRYINFKQLLYPTNHVNNTPLIRFLSIQFTPTDAWFLSNFHDYFSKVTAEDMLLSIRNKVKVRNIYSTYDNCSDLIRFLRANFICDTIAEPNQIADDQFFVFSIRFVSLFSFFLFIRHPSILFDRSIKLDNLTSALAKIISYRGREFSILTNLVEMTPIKPVPYEFAEISPQVSNIIDRLNLTSVSVGTTSADSSALRMMTHPIFNSAFRVFLSKGFVQQVLKHDGLYYRVKDWASDFSQLNLSFASINSRENVHLMSACSVAPPSLDAISENLSVYSRAGGYLLGRLYEYIEEICYLMSREFREDPLPDLPENYNDSKLVFDPIFHRYERSIRLHILSAVQPVDFFEVICRPDVLSSKKFDRLNNDFRAHVWMFTSCYKTQSCSNTSNYLSEQFECNHAADTDEASTESDNVVVKPRARRANTQLKRRVHA